MKGLVILTSLTTSGVYFFDLVKGWEIMMFSALTFMLLWFHIHFIKYVDQQKRWKSSDGLSKDQDG